MAPKTTPPAPVPVSDVSLQPKGAIFISGIELLGHGTTASYHVDRFRDLSPALHDLGLLLTHADGRQMLIPWPAIKAVFL